jgi:hypothetical protein
MEFDCHLLQIADASANTAGINFRASEFWTDDGNSEVRNMVEHDRDQRRPASRAWLHLAILGPSPSLLSPFSSSIVRYVRTSMPELCTIYGYMRDTAELQGNQTDCSPSQLPTHKGTSHNTHGRSR